MKIEHSITFTEGELMAAALKGMNIKVKTGTKPRMTVAKNEDRFGYTYGISSIEITYESD